MVVPFGLLALGFGRFASVVRIWVWAAGGFLGGLASCKLVWHSDFIDCRWFWIWCLGWVAVVWGCGLRICGRFSFLRIWFWIGLCLILVVAIVDVAGVYGGLGFAGLVFGVGW